MKVEPQLGEVSGVIVSSARRVPAPVAPAGGLVSWLGVLALFVALIATCIWLGQLAGFYRLPTTIEGPDVPARALVVGGLLLGYIAHFAATAVLFKRSFVQGGLSLFVPGYFLVALRRQGLYWVFVGTFVFAFACVAAGTIMLS